MRRKVSATAFVHLIDTSTDPFPPFSACREPMVDEQKHEVTTYPDASDHSIDLDDDDEGFATLGTSPPTRIPEAAAVGQALEEVIRLAEDLQEGFAAQSAKSNAPPTPSTSASSPSVHLDHPPPQQHQQQQQAWMDPLTSRDINKETGLLSRLFKNRTRTPSMHSAASAASTSTPNGGSRHAPWSVYEKDFQDV